MKVTEKDWIKLSAYLDDELKRREKERLEERVQSSPQLRAALEQLKTTKKILKATPEIPVPRNYTLSPEMVGLQVKRPAPVGFRLAAALATFLLIGVIMLDFGRFVLGGAMAPAAPEMEKVMLESAADEIDQPEAFSAESEELDEQVLEEVPAAPAEEAAPLVEAESLEEETAERAAEGAEDQELDVAKEADQEPKAELEVGEAAPNQMEIQKTSALPTPAPSQTPTPQPTVEVFYAEDMPSPGLFSRISVFRVLEIILGLSAIGFGVAAWIKRRQR